MGMLYKTLGDGYWHPKDTTEELNGLLAEGWEVIKKNPVNRILFCDY